MLEQPTAAATTTTAAPTPATVTAESTAAAITETVEQRSHVIGILTTQIEGETEIAAALFDLAARHQHLAEVSEQGTVVRR